MTDNHSCEDCLPNSVLLGVATLDDLLKAVKCDPLELKKLFDGDERLVQNVSDTHGGFPSLATWRILGWLPYSRTNRYPLVAQIGAVVDIEHKVRRIFNSVVFFNGNFFPTLEEDPNKEEALGVVTNLRSTLYAMVAQYVASTHQLRTEYPCLGHYDGNPQQTITELFLKDPRLIALSKTDVMAAHYLRKLSNGFDMIAEGRLLVLNAERYFEDENRT